MKMLNRLMGIPWVQTVIMDEGIPSSPLWIVVYFFIYLLGRINNIICRKTLQNRYFLLSLLRSFSLGTIPHMPWLTSGLGSSVRTRWELRALISLFLLLDFEWAKWFELFVLFYPPFSWMLINFQSCLKIGWCLPLLWCCLMVGVLGRYGFSRLLIF